MFEHVLVPVDGSAVASAALELALKVAGSDTRITLIEVVDTVPRILAHATPAGFELGVAPIDAHAAEQVVGYERTAAAGHLEAAVTRLKSAGFTRTETVIVDGLPGQAIIDAVRANACDLVIMGTHGRSLLRKEELGSVAAYVVRFLRDVPVMLIHPAGTEI